MSTIKKVDTFLFLIIVCAHWWECFRPQKYFFNHTKKQQQKIKILLNSHRNDQKASANVENAFNRFNSTLITHKLLEYERKKNFIFIVSLQNSLVRLLINEAINKVLLLHFYVNCRLSEQQQPTAHADKEQQFCHFSHELRLNTTLFSLSHREFSTCENWNF